MKTLLLSIAMLLGTGAIYAQNQPLRVNNGSTSDVVIYLGVTENSTCSVTMATMAIPLQAGASISVPALVNSANYSWYQIRVITNITGGSLGPAPSSATSHNKCLLQCSPPADVSNGLTAIWDTSMNCNTVDIN